ATADAATTKLPGGGRFDRREFKILPGLRPAVSLRPLAIAGGARSDRQHGSKPVALLELAVCLSARVSGAVSRLDRSGKMVGAQRPSLQRPQRSPELVAGSGRAKVNRAASGLPGAQRERRVIRPLPDLARDRRP